MGVSVRSGAARRIVLHVALSAKGMGAYSRTSLRTSSERSRASAASSRWGSRLFRRTSRGFLKNSPRALKGYAATMMELDDEDLNRRDIEQYLAPRPLGPPGYAHPQQVKLPCGENGERTFCRETKCWGTTSLLQPQQLLGRAWGSRSARPGAQRLAHGRRPRQARRRGGRVIAQQAKRAQGQGEGPGGSGGQGAAGEAAQGRRAARGKQRRDEATAREAAKIKVDPEVGKLAVQLGISTHEAAQILARPDVVPSKRELDECHALGFTQEAIAHSG